MTPSCGASGDLDSHLQTIADWSEPNREGTVYYGEAAARGVLLWNLFAASTPARPDPRGDPVEQGALLERVG